MIRKRILVVDDDIYATRLLKVSLEKNGVFEVCEVNQGSEALAAAQEFRPDAILLDVWIPDVEGSVVASQIKDDPDLRATPIVFLTSIVSERELTEKGNIIGGQRYLAKPMRVEKIVACLENILRMRPQHGGGTAGPRPQFVPSKS